MTSTSVVKESRKDVTTLSVVKKSGVGCCREMTGVSVVRKSGSKVTSTSVVIFSEGI